MKVMIKAAVLSLINAGILEASSPPGKLNLNNSKEEKSTTATKRQKIVDIDNTEPYNSGHIESFKTVLETYRQQVASSFNIKIPKKVFDWFPEQFCEGEKPTKPLNYTRITKILSDIEGQLINVDLITTELKENYEKAKNAFIDKNEDELAKTISVYNFSTFGDFQNYCRIEADRRNREKTRLEAAKGTLRKAKSNLDIRISNEMTQSEIIQHLKTHEDPTFDTSTPVGLTRVKALLADIYGITE